MADRLYFRQLLSGRDFAVGDAVAEQMVNFAYLLGDRRTGDAVVVDPAYRVDDLLDRLEADGMRLSGVLVTHYHPDHVGGSFGGHQLEGVREVLTRASVPVHVHEAEAAGVRKVTGAGASDLALHEGGDRVRVGEIEIELLHTPGHTPGSQCFLVDRMLVSGDTLFLDGCGRTDLPGSDPGQMYDSLQRLSTLPDDVAVFPGHRYSPASCGAMAAVRELNYVFKPSTKDAWLQMFGG